MVIIFLKLFGCKLIKVWWILFDLNWKILLVWLWLKRVSVGWLFKVMWVRLKFGWCWWIKLSVVFIVVKLCKFSRLILSSFSDLMVFFLNWVMSIVFGLLLVCRGIVLIKGLVVKIILVVWIELWWGKFFSLVVIFSR